MSDEKPVIRSFSSGSVFRGIENVGTDSTLLREVADWLEEPGPRRVLISLASVGFGEADEIILQVVATEMPAALNPKEGSEDD